MPISPLRRSTRIRAPLPNAQLRATRQGTVFGRVSKPRTVRTSSVKKNLKPVEEDVVDRVPTSPVSQNSLELERKVECDSFKCQRVSPLSLSFHPEGPPLGREVEYERLTKLVGNAVENPSSSCAVYVCGTPGTGKTLTVSKVVKRLRTPPPNPDIVDLVSDSETEDNSQDPPQPPSTIWVNCAHLANPKDVFEEVAQSLAIPTTARHGNTNQAIRQFAQTCGPKIVIVLDEVDFLASRDQLVLYATFEWPRLQNSRLAVIGIANSIDLPVRMLPWLRANNCMPEVVSFAPYNSKALQAIVEQRVQTVDNTESSSMLSKVAISLAAKKVAAGSGDARLVLDVCREADTAIKRDGGNTPQSVSIVASLLNKRGGVSAAVDTIRQLPVQQQLALCVAANAVAFSEPASVVSKGKKGMNRKATLGGLYDSFIRMCARVKVPCVPFTEFADICCNALVHHSLLEVANGRGGRGKKASLTVRSKAVRLRIPLEDVRAGVADRGFLPLLLAR